MSDHSGSIYPLVYGLSNNYSVLEFHVTFHKKMFGPDNSSSISFEKVKELSKFRENFETLTKNKIDKDKIFKKFKLTKKMFGKSLSLIKSRKKNYLIKSDDLTMKKPGTGLPLSKKIFNW